MAHKTLIGGTAYEISGGKTLVGGTAYAIDKGETLIGGTAYEVGFGVNWNKYSVTKVVTYSDPKVLSETKETWFANSSYTKRYYYDTYTYDKSTGVFTLTGINSAYVTDTTGADNIVGKYGDKSYVGSNSKTEPKTATSIYKYTRYDYSNSNNGCYYFYYKHITRSIESTTYLKGETSYGVVNSSSGELPEGGTLISGSVEGDFCVVYVNYGYYYYERA